MTNSVLLVASEAYPYAKTGGMADFVASLPPALARSGWQATVVLPRYRGLPEGLTVCIDSIFLGGQHYEVRYAELSSGAGGRTIAVDCPPLFDRDGLYAGADGEYRDNPLRFALLSLAALQFAATRMPLPDVIHANDWHTGLIPMYLRTRPELATLHTNAATVFTVHNVAFQGMCDARWLAPLDIPQSEFQISSLEFYGQINFMKAGIVGADIVATVSPSYAAEISTPESGCGLHGVVRSRGAAVQGILNGIDEELWDPNTDSAIATHYDSDHPEGKSNCRRALQVELGLDADDDALLVAVVSRFTAQKGIDLVLAAMPALLGQGVQFAIQGTGESALEAAFRQAHREQPGRMHVTIGYDEGLAHRLIAGADAILIPSRFEPCGLTQLYGLRYGTLPIVRSVGGLADSVDAEVGFKFNAATPSSLMKVLATAIEVFRREPARWRSMMAAAMRRDHTWFHTSQHYGHVYRQAIAHHRGEADRQ